jgi:uncharacterized protein YkvS
MRVFHVARSPIRGSIDPKSTTITINPTFSGQELIRVHEIGHAIDFRNRREGTNQKERDSLLSVLTNIDSFRDLSQREMPGEQSQQHFHLISRNEVLAHAFVQWVAEETLAKKLMFEVKRFATGESLTRCSH